MCKNDLKILTIGNSFTDSLHLFFHQVVESVPGCTLLFERANHGGCELHRHWSYIENEEKDGVYRMYQDSRFRMREILTREAWDIVTIQQASHFSWRRETFQPFANLICDYVRKHAPQAEIVIQQTWAYREDDPRVRPGGEWEFDAGIRSRCAELGVTLDAGPWHVSQTDMYHGLTAAYTELAREQNLRIIPTGYAVQLSRQKESKPFHPYDPELLKTLLWPDLPSQSGDVVGSMGWGKNKVTGEMEIGRDTIHLNSRGQYLQACVWFAFLYGRSAREVTFVPNSIGDADAESLRETAQMAVETFQQVKK